VRERGVHSAASLLLVPDAVRQVRRLGKAGRTVPEIMRRACIQGVCVPSSRNHAIGHGIAVGS
jgi:hypothetical protein